jgi:hypothetical protein
MSLYRVKETLQILACMAIFSAQACWYVARGQLAWWVRAVRK